MKYLSLYYFLCTMFAVSAKDFEVYHHQVMYSDHRILQVRMKSEYKDYLDIDSRSSTFFEDFLFKYLRDSTYSKYLIQSVVSDNARVVFEYDSNGNMLSEVHENLVNGVWKKSYRYNQVFDSCNNLSSRVLEYYLTNGTWKGSYRDTYTRNCEGDVLTHLREDFDAGGWRYKSKETHVYEKENKTELKTYMVWKNNDWEKDMRSKVIRDESGKLISMSAESYENGAWTNSSRFILTWNKLGNLLIQLRENWKNDEWINSEKEIYTYDKKGNLLSKISSFWMGGLWQDRGKDIYTYNGKGNIVTLIQQRWESNSLVNYSKQVHTHDANNNTRTSKVYNWVKGAWITASPGQGMAYFYYNNNHDYFIFPAHYAVANYTKITLQKTK